MKTRHERRAGAHPHAGRRRRGRVLHQPRHLGDALRRRGRRGRRACARSSVCSRASSPARPTATGAWPTARRPRCSTSDRAWPTASPTCTTPGGRGCRWSTSSATTRRTTSSTTRRSSPTSTRPRRTFSGWVRRPMQTETSHSPRPRPWRRRSARPRQIATLILPADVSWGEGATPASPAPAPAGATVADDVVERVAKVLRVRRAVRAAAGRARPTGRPPSVAAEPHRVGHRRPHAHRDVPDAPRTGRGRAGDRPPAVPRRVRRRAARRDAPPVLVDAKSPVAFFAYPGKPSDLVPEGCEVHVLAGPDDDSSGALAHLADRVGGRAWSHLLAPASRARPPVGRADRRSRRARARRVAARGRGRGRRGQHRRASGSPARPRARRGTTGSRSPAARSASACPLATGAAVACPDRKVICLAGRRQRDVHAPGALDAWRARASTSPR